MATTDQTETTTVRVYDDDVERLDDHNTREESYADTFRRLLDRVESTDD